MDYHQSLPASCSNLLCLCQIVVLSALLCFCCSCELPSCLHFVAYVVLAALTAAERLAYTFYIIGHINCKKYKYI